MSRLNVNPTRMELSNLKKNLATAFKGHRLLKDKRDELMRQFIKTVREAVELRKQVDEKISKSRMYLESAAAIMGEKELKTALLISGVSDEMVVGKKNAMSILLPRFSWKNALSNQEICSYGYANTSADLDTSVKILGDTRDDLLKLAELEKSIELMSGEIERTRRRVNALEYVIIPDYQETIRYIKMKLDENERENSIRLLKVKDIVLEEKIKK